MYGPINIRTTKVFHLFIFLNMEDISNAVHGVYPVG